VEPGQLAPETLNKPCRWPPLCQQPNLSKNGARKNSSRVVGKRPRRLMGTVGQVPHRLSSAMSAEQPGVAQPGNVCVCYRAAE